jgi:hypothetical protein
MSLTGAQRQPYRKAIGIHERMNFAGQRTTQPPHRLPPVADDASCVLMHTGKEGIDSGQPQESSAECVYNSAPDTSSPPAKDTVIASGVWVASIRSRRSAPNLSTQKMPLRTADRLPGEALAAYWAASA